MTTPILGLTELAAAQSQPHLIVNATTRYLEAVARGVVKTVNGNTPAASPADGDMHVVGTSPTGAWSGKAKNLALYSVNGWVFFAPATEQLVRNQTDNKPYRYTGSAWAIWNPAASDTVAVNADSFPTTADAADDEFETGSSIDTAGTRRAGATAWTWVNQSTSTGDLKNGSLVLAIPGSSSDAVRAVVQAQSGSAWKYRAKVAVKPTTYNSGVYTAGFIVRNSSSNKSINFGKTYASGTLRAEVTRWNSTTSYSAAVATNSDIIGSAPGMLQPWYLEVELASSTLYFRYSWTGVDTSFIEFTTEALATHISSVTDVGLFVLNASVSNATSGIFDWFRRLS